MPAARIAVVSCALALGLLHLPGAAQGGEAIVAVVDFDLIDTSLHADFGPPLKSDLKRLERTETQIRELIDKSTLFDVVDAERTEPISRELRQKYHRLHACNGCELELGEATGADYVLVGWVQKVSNLILNLNLVLRKVPGGEDIVGSSVDMRGNTDEAWSRAADYIIEREVIPEYKEVVARRKPKRSV